MYNNADYKYKLYCECPVVDKLGKLFGRSQKYRLGNGEKIETSGCGRPRLQRPAHFKPGVVAAPSGSRVTVHNLKSLNDGGILDPDDKLNDVADDREQIIAIYDDNGAPYLVHNGGDGTSASSVGTESPDMFHIADIDSKSDSQIPCHTDVEIDCVPLGISTLQVRRGSEPALNQLSPIPNVYLDPMKRWSTAVVLDEKGSGYPPPPPPPGKGRPEHPTPVDELPMEREDGSGEEKSAFTPFSRDSGRLSILGNSSDMYRWADAADRQLLKMNDGRRDPVGGPNIPVLDEKHGSDSIEIQLVVLRNDGGPLGIHVVPEYDDNGRDFGLVVQGIEPGGKIDQDGRIRVKDRIVEINGKGLVAISFHRAQDIFKEAMQASEIRLRLARGGRGKLPPPVFPRPEACSGIDDGRAERESPNFDERSVSGPPGTTGKSLVNVSRTTKAMLAANTRRIGKKYPIQLTKGANGLGFSITTRDNIAGGNCPVYIKNILPRGAALEDGRLQPGDRLLEVNGTEMTGLTQDESVRILRNIPTGSVVNLVISRQEPESPRLPRQLMGSDYHSDCGEAAMLPAPTLRAPPPDRLTDDGLIFPWKHRELLTFDIPLNDTGSAGLGVSVKGKTSTGPNGVVDLGIFVKSVINGGAASKDGRLKENDQLININGVSLLGMPNSHSMETLRRVMHQEGPNPGAITLSIARRVSAGQAAERSAALSGHPSLLTYPAVRGVTIGQASTASSADSSSSCTNGRIHTTPSEASMTSTSLDSDRTAVYRPYGQQTGHLVGEGLNGRSEEEEDNDRNLNCSGVTKIEDKDLGLDCPSASHVRNPIIERITGQKAPRNDSFYQACHDSWNSPQFKQYMGNGKDMSQPPPPPPHHSHRQLHVLPVTGSSVICSPTISAMLDESVMIEDEYVGLKAQSSAKAKPPNRTATPEKFLSASVQGRTSDGEPKRVVGEGDPGDPNFNYTSQISLDEEGPNFARDGFGRQSMSEKRNAQLDARNTDTWQRNKKAREEREKQRQHDGGDSEKNGSSNLIRSNSADSVVSAAKAQNAAANNKDGGLKKSNSLESLPKDGGQGLEGNIYDHHPNRAVRNRGCNESFRAAVDRSYEAPHGQGDAMDTLEEESESGSSGNVGRGSLRQHAGSVSSEPMALDDLGRFGKKEKKKGLLKNLGSVFKFGKIKKEPGSSTGTKHGAAADEVVEHYTKIDPESLYARETSGAADDGIGGGGGDVERYREHQRKMSEGRSQPPAPHQLRQQQGVYPAPPPPSHVSHPSHQPFQNGSYSGSLHTAWPTSSGSGENSQLRHDRITHLRAQHQKKHQERRGQYPQDEKEEKLQKQAQEQVDRKAKDSNGLKKVKMHGGLLAHRCHLTQFQCGPNKGLLAFEGTRRSCRDFTFEQRYESEVFHSRSHSYDLYQEGSRHPVKLVAESKSNKYSHYMNYEEIQQHILMQQQQKQQQQPPHHHHRPPVPPAGRRDRPVSNYYEYESIIPTYNPATETYTIQPRNGSRTGVVLARHPPNSSQTQQQQQEHHHHRHPHQAPPPPCQVVSHGSLRSSRLPQTSNLQRRYEPAVDKAKFSTNHRSAVHPTTSSNKYVQMMRTRDLSFAGSKV